MKKKKFLDITKQSASLSSIDISDNDLVVTIREKNPEMYGDLIDRYQGKLFAYLYRLVGDKEEARDLLQEVFIKTYKNLYSFDDTRKFSSWIYRIAHNEAVNYLKRRALKRFISWEDVVSTKDQLEMKSNEDDANTNWIRKEDDRNVNMALDRLPSKYKQVLTLRFYADKSYEEISEILGKPVNTVGTLINRAKKRLHKELDNLNSKNNINAWR